MKGRLALLRHADPAPGGLSPLGERQAAQLARQLLESGPGVRGHVLSSPAPRARRTASPVCAVLGLPEPELDPRLWSGPDGVPGAWDEDPDGLAERLDGRLAELDLLVVVSHFEICACLPGSLGRRWGWPGGPPDGLSRGQGLLLSPATGRWTHLPG